ncbi:SurA N-terminal domain-containing protein [Actinopolyspora mortivallis]|uniref:SurA N-terminal domain-containing protein n=1 Tax=Actinopolyspora mortivallis TaxID=33906 RepID=UPI0003A5583D|nr:SurA N-terminal domain-containing protein [Actinopolyspora mortivallis]
MRSVIVGPRLIVALLAVALLAGCGSQPARMGSAAIVGDHAIPLDTVEERFDTVLRSRPQMRQQLENEKRTDELASRIAGFTVRQELAERAARRRNLRVTDEEVTEWINEQGGPKEAMRGTIFAADQARSVGRSLLLMRELGSSTLPGASVRFDYTSATTRADAQRKAELMARGPERAKELVEQDSSSGVSAATGRTLRAARNPRLAVGTPLFAAEPGTTLAFRLPGRDATRWMVARVTERDVRSEDTDSDRRVRQQLARGFGVQLLGLTAQREGVEISPRYGVWDPVGVNTAPAEDQTRGFRIPPRSNSV